MNFQTTSPSNDHPGSASGTPVLRYAAFTDANAGGNPAGVVLDAAGLSDDAQRAIAADVGFSETAFVEPDRRENTFRVRFFSPLAEVAFCGHATIATAVALAERHGPGQLIFNTLAGPIDVATEATPKGFTATLTSVPTRTRPAAPTVLADALDALRWRPKDIDPQYPAHVAFAGNNHLICVVHERSRLADLDYDYDALAAVMAEYDWTTLQLLYAHSPTRFSARNPFPPGGVIEDPATGAAAAAFGGYLRALNLVDLPAQVTLLQGEDMGRASRLLVDLTTGSDRVRVTGAATSID